MSGFGAFGKMPALGDFFRFDLPADFVGPWDRWLQAGLLAARARLGTDFERGYMTAPIWRFTLAPGLAGSAAMEGVLMASVDRVGRVFPLTLARPLDGTVDAVAAHLCAAATRRFARLEAIALEALEESMTRERIAALLAAEPDPDAGPGRPAGAAVAGGGGFLALAPSADPAVELAATLAAATFGRPAVFTALVGDERRLVLAEGLPPAERMAVFFAPDRDAAP
jgi:type VI secretion system protein ImpM